MAHYKKSVIKSKTSKHMIYILRITTILFPMKQNIQETSKWPLWSESDCPAQWYDSECAVNPIEHIRKPWTSSWEKPREEHSQILVFFKKDKFAFFSSPFIGESHLTKDEANALDVCQSVTKGLPTSVF